MYGYTTGMPSLHACKTEERLHSLCLMSMKDLAIFQTEKESRTLFSYPPAFLFRLDGVSAKLHNFYHISNTFGILFYIFFHFLVFYPHCNIPRKSLSFLGRQWFFCAKIHIILYISNSFLIHFGSNHGFCAKCKDLCYTKPSIYSSSSCANLHESGFSRSFVKISLAFSNSPYSI